MSDAEKASLRGETLWVKNLSYRKLPNPKGKHSDVVLNNLSFSIEAGEKVGILGSIGSGKKYLSELFESSSES